MSKCDGPNCDADVVWAETPSGARQPFDREPAENGNRVLLGRGPNRPPLAIPASEFDPHNPTYDRPEWLAGCLYVPHHATCPDRDRFKGSRKETPDGSS